MEPALATVLGAAIGAAAGISGGMLTGWRQTRLEREKWLRGREDILANELRVSLQQLTVRLAAAVHSMCWLTWLAKEGPSRLTQERIDGYDKEIHELLPQITSQQAMVAALNREAFDRLSSLVDRVLLADARIGQASLEFSSRDPKSATALAVCYEDTQTLEHLIPREVADIIGRALRGLHASPNKQLQPPGPA